MIRQEWKSQRTASSECNARIRIGLPPALLGCLLLLGVVATWAGKQMGSGNIREVQIQHESQSQSAASPPELKSVNATGAAGTTTFYQRRVQPIFDRSCVGCHGSEKSKGGLRLDTYVGLMAGGDSGAVVVPGAADRSELYRRITLPHDDDEVMPSDGKKLLSGGDRALLALWIEGGAALDTDVPELASGATAPDLVAEAAPDYRPYQHLIAALEAELPVRLVPISRSATDGVILRTISEADRVDDVVIAALAPVAPLIVDAELSRTRITDKALGDIAHFTNLRRLDLGHTRITSAGVAHLAGLLKLQSINLVATQVDDSAWGTLRRMPALRNIYGFETRMEAAVDTR